MSFEAERLSTHRQYLSKETFRKIPHTARLIVKELVKY
jgi:hypothetical protein